MAEHDSSLSGLGTVGLPRRSRSRTAESARLSSTRRRGRIALASSLRPPAAEHVGRTSHLPDRPSPRARRCSPRAIRSFDHVEGHARRAGSSFCFGAECRAYRAAETAAGCSSHLLGRARRAPGRALRPATRTSRSFPTGTGGEFAGELIHAADYRNPEALQGQAVLVVGPGCSGMEIAHDLAERGAAKVWLAVRTPPNIILARAPAASRAIWTRHAFLHLPGRFGDAVTRSGRRQDFGDLSEYGLPGPRRRA